MKSAGFDVVLVDVHPAHDLVTPKRGDDVRRRFSNFQGGALPTALER